MPEMTGIEVLDTIGRLACVEKPFRPASLNALVASFCSERAA